MRRRCFLRLVTDQEHDGHVHLGGEIPTYAVPIAFTQDGALLVLIRGGLLPGGHAVGLPPTRLLGIVF
jgi:hypothetical protein